MEHNCKNCYAGYKRCYNRIDNNNTSCEWFIPSKCYYCAIYQLGECKQSTFPKLCIDFKKGNNLDEWKKDTRLEESKLYIERNRTRAERRRLTAIYDNKMKRKAADNQYIRGPWFNTDKGRVIIIDRGKRSKWLKKIGNKRVRKSNIALRRAEYRKLFDYWWELD